MQHPPSASTGRLRTPTGISLAAGCAAAVGTAVVAGALFPDGEIAGRAAVMAIMVGVYAAKVADLRAVLGVTGVAMLVYVGFLVNDLGELMLHSATWPYLIPLGSAAVLGWARHRLRARPHGRQRPSSVRLSGARRRHRPPAKVREAQGAA